jgi:hypothetical protein
MSTRYRITPDLNNPLISSSMATSFNGPPTNINGIPGISYDLSWTGTPVGTFQVQVSNTYVPNPTPGGTALNAGNWTTLPPSSFTGTYPVPAGTANNGFLDVVGTEAAWVRLQYTATSGAGTLTVLAAAKDF